MKIGPGIGDSHVKVKGPRMALFFYSSSRSPMRLEKNDFL